ncbi:MAG: ROK family transcriptional regulator [Deinococcales bacterium]
MNSEAILHALRDKGPLSRAELARELGLSRPTVSKLVEKLLLAEWVKEIGEGRSVGGRRPVLLSFNQRAGYVLAIDLGGTKALCGVTDLTGKVVAQVKRPSRMSEGPEVSLPALDRTLDETTRKAGISPDQLMAIGVSSPGVMDPRSETFAFAPNLRGFGDVSLSKFLHEKYGVSVVITNDVNAALLGESWLGAARGWRHVVMVSVGTGLGAGILVDGKLYKGASGGAGEVGYMAFDERAAQTKEHGFFETVASGYGFAEAASSMPWAKPGPASEQDGVLDADSRTQELIERAQRGETEAAGVVHQFAKYMALGINNIVGLLDPEIVVLGGSMMIQHDWLMRKVVERFHEYSTFSVPIRLAELGDASGLYGAVKQALDLVFSSRFAAAGGREARRYEDGLRSGGTW